MSAGERILILGATGQLGARLAQQWGVAAVGLTRGACDLAGLDAAGAEALLARYRPPLLINAAAYTAVDHAEEERALAMRINAEAPGLLARAAAAAGIPFVHFSTDYVFDGARGAPYATDATPNPCNHYGASKYAGEQQVLAAGGQGYIFRLQWVYDARGRNFLATMRRLLEKETAPCIVADQLGAPTPAQSIAQAIRHLAPRMAEGALPPGMYHLTSGGYTSWHGFACAIARRLGGEGRMIRPILTQEYPTLARRPLDTRLDGRALAAHGVVLPHWRDGLAATLNEEPPCI